MTTTLIIHQIFIVFMVSRCGYSVQIIDSLSNDIRSYISRGVDVPHQGEPWQLPDIVTEVDAVLQRELGLRKHIGKFKVTEINKPELPKWLTYSSETDSLEGIPSAADLGRYYISVAPENDPSSKHYFVITVKETASPDTPLPLSHVKTMKYHCRKDDPLTIASVIVDANPDDLTQSMKIHLVKEFAAHLNLTLSTLRLSSLGGRPAYDATALVAGPGNSREQKHPGVLVSWQIGCGTVDAGSMSVLETVESSSASGKLSSAIAHPIVGWHVTNNRPQVRALKRRRKRQVYATAALEKVPPSEYAGDMNRVIPSQATPGHDYMKTGRVEPTRRFNSRAQTLAITPSKPTVLATKIVPSPSKPAMMMTPSVRLPPVRPSNIEVRPTPSSSKPTKPLPSTPKVVDVKPSKNVDIRPTKIIDKPAKSSEYEPEDTNQKPEAVRRIPRITARVGQVLHYKIPEDIFYDAEDGNTRNLKLIVMEGGITLPRTSWVRFNNKEQLLYGLPMLKDETRRVYTYSLSAIDSYGKIARTQFEIVVMRHRYNKASKNKGRRLPSHEFILVLAEKYEKFISDIDNSISVVRKIAQVYGEPTTNNILVRSMQPGSVRFAWTNTTLRRKPCPQKAILGLMRYIIRDNDTVNPRLVEIMKPFKIKTVLARSLGSCSDVAFVPGKPMDGISISPTDPTGKGGKSISNIGDVNRKFLINVIIPIATMGFFIIVATIVACILYQRRRRGKLATDEKQTFVNKGIPVIFADEIDDKPDPPTKPLILEEERPPQPPPQYHSMPRSTPSRKNGPPPMYNAVEMRRLVDFDEQQRDNSPPYQPPPPITAPNGSRNAKPRSNAHKQKPFYVPP